MLTHSGHIRNGKFYLDRPESFRPEAIAAIQEGGFLIHIEPVPNKISNKFMRYYRGPVLTGLLNALNEAGNSIAVTSKNRQIAHEALRDGPLFPAPVEGVQNSTARLRPGQFEMYVRAVIEAVQECLDYEIAPPPVNWKTLEEE